jgi:(2Fe-2S) ferredoxin
VYPEGIWYYRVTPTLLERIVVEHLRQGKPVEEAIFFRLGD